MTPEADTPKPANTKARLAALEGRAAFFGQMLASHHKMINELWDDYKSRSDAKISPEKAPPDVSGVKSGSDVPETPPAASTGEIGWGREIEVNGERPEWLTDNATPVRWAHRYSNAVTDAGNLTWDNGTDGGAVETIHLPADHPAYVALDAGFEPFSGETRPSDWDGGDTLLADGDRWDGGEDGTDWTADVSPSRRVICYHRKPEATLTAATDRLNAQTAEMRGNAPAIDWSAPIELSDGTAAQVAFFYEGAQVAHAAVLTANGKRDFLFDGTAYCKDSDALDWPVAGRTIRNVAERVEYIRDCDRPDDPPMRVASEPKHAGITADDLTTETVEYYRLRLADVEAERDAAWVAGELAGRQQLAHSEKAAHNAAMGQKARAESAEALTEKYKWQVRDTCTRAEKAEAERDELRAAIPECLCDKCQMVHTKPANPITLGCPNCAGIMRPSSVNERQAEAALAEEVSRCARMSDTIRHQREEIGKLHAWVPRYTDAQRVDAQRELSRMYNGDAYNFGDMIDAIATALGLRKAEG